MTDYRIKTVEEYRELRGDSHQMIYDKSMTVMMRTFVTFWLSPPF